MQNKNIIKQGDHLILPYSTLKRFVDDKNEISVLDLSNFNNVIVKRMRPKSYHVKKNYYNPEYDDEVKKMERLIGILHTKVSKAIGEIERGFVPSEQFDRDELKTQIIDLATIEFHRLVIVDDEKLKQYCEQQQRENDEIDKKLLRVGELTKERCDYSINYREKAKSLELFRYYAQNILGTKNTAISEQYKEFESTVMYISSNANYSFWLPPFHFIGNECFLVFIISPRIALALYPTFIIQKQSSQCKYGLFYKIDETRVSAINSRVLESIGCMPNGFRELIGIGVTGTKDNINDLKAFVDKIRANTAIIEKTDKTTIKIDGLNEFLKDELSLFRTAIVLRLMMGNVDEGKVIDLIINSIDPDNTDKNEYIKITEIFKKYNFHLIK